ncbi:4Fe-4S binding protein [bacterium]|nr:4Fe-4S binding protein [bacterium]
MFEEIIKKNNCFKLICGAGNENIEEVEKLAFIYSKAGCNIFDVSANVEVIRAAKRGIERSEINDNRFICVSVGTSEDIHFSKAYINPDKCKRCLKCFSVCPQRAIKSCVVDETKCIGCQKCYRICAYEALEIKNYPTDIEKIIPTIIKEGIDCIELHAISTDEDEILNKWKYINDNFDGIMSICLNRSKFSNEKLVKLLRKILEIRKGKSTIIQADGAPMSGGVDDYNSTLQAVACADIINKENLQAYIFISGGTNSKSRELANLCNVNINGVAIGSYARKIVKDYLCDKMSFEEALNIAAKLVKSC